MDKLGTNRHRKDQSWPSLFDLVRPTQPNTPLSTGPLAFPAHAGKGREESVESDDVDAICYRISLVHRLG